MSPVSNAGDFTVTPNADGLTPVRDLGGVEFLLDAISAMQGNGTILTGFSDRSGKGRVCTIGNAPAYANGIWTGGGGLPALRFTRTSDHYIKVNLPALIPQPFTIFSVIDLYCGDGDAAGNQNIINSGGGISYRISNSDRWSMFGGNAVQTSIVASASTGKVVRFDVFNGVNSQCFRSGTASGVVNAGNGQTGGQQCGIGARNDGIDPASVIVAACGLISHALSAAERAFLLAFYTNRFGGISSV